MSKKPTGPGDRHRYRRQQLAVLVGSILAGCAVTAPAQAHESHQRDGGPQLTPGNLLISGSRYATADIQPGVTVLPPAAPRHARSRTTMVPIRTSSTTISSTAALGSPRGSSSTR